ncbi:MAG: flagellar hook-associated protein 3 FlgL [Gammaproteobacteria bacterium]|jgi:flagellar hook-associated protein 3 FlgL
MTRVSSSQVFSQALADLRLNQREIARLQDGVGSGLRIQKPSDDPAGASRALNLSEALERVEQYESNSRLADQRLALEDTTLESVQNLMQRIKELALAANSGAQTEQTRFAYRAELDERLDELVDLSNVRDVNGDYLFAGFQDQSEPFSLGATGVSYAGDQGAREVQISATRRIVTGDSGDQIFMRVPVGNGRFSVSADAVNTGSGVMSAGGVIDPGAFTSDAYSVRFTGPNTFDVVNDTLGATVLAAQTFTAGASIAFDGIETRINGQPATGDRFDIAPAGTQSLFDTVRDFIAAMGQSPADPAASAKLTQEMNHVIDSLDRGLDHVLEARASVGARQNAIESTETQHEDLRFELQSSLSQTQDLDMTEAISLLQQRLTALQAVQQSFVAISRLSLFDYLR